jgi:hypothetical protein
MAHMHMVTNADDRPAATLIVERKGRRQRRRRKATADDFSFQVNAVRRSRSSWTARTT